MTGSSPPQHTTLTRKPSRQRQHDNEGRHHETRARSSPRGSLALAASPRRSPSPHRRTPPPATASATAASSATTTTATRPARSPTSPAPSPTTARPSPSCYDFKGAGNGKGLCVKNNAASVWNRSSKTVRVYFNSGYGGTYQSFAAGAKANLNATLKNNNASHKFGPFSSASAARPPVSATRAPAREPCLGQQPPRQHLVGHRHVRPRRGPGLRLVQQRFARRLPALDPGAQLVQARAATAPCRPAAWPSSPAARRATAT